MKTTGERRQVGSANEEPIGFAGAQTSLEMHTVPALEGHATSMGVQGVRDACVNGELELGTLSSGESHVLDLQVLVSVQSVQSILQLCL